MQDQNSQTSQVGSQPDSTSKSSQVNQSSYGNNPQNTSVPSGQSAQNVRDGIKEPVEQVDTRLKNALVEEVQQAPVPLSNQPKPPKSKKGLVKMLIFFFGFFALLSVLVFLFIKLRDSGTFIPSGTKGEIVWWGLQHDLSVYQSLIDEFEKDNPHIKIVYKKQSTQDYLQRLQNELATEEGPDIFEIHNTWSVMLKNELSALPSSVMTKEEFAKSYYPIIVSNLSLEKGIVGIPLEYDALTLFINDDVFTSALKTPPDWWDELPKLAQELTQNPGNVIVQGGVALGITDNVDHWPEIIGLMLIQDGVNPAKPIGTAATKVFSYYNQFAGLKVWNNILPNSTLAFARGELAMYFGPTRRASEIVSINPNLKFRTVKLPQLRKNNQDDPNYSYATYWVQAVSEKSIAKDAAWMFLKYLSREDSLRKINENIAKYETFERVYPRPNMNSEMSQDSILGSIIYFAYDARSFYLADETHDGNDGINTLVNNVYKKTVGAKISEKFLLGISQELSKVLSKFGIKVR